MQELRKDALLKLFGGILCIVTVITFILCWNRFDWSFFDVCRFFLIAGAVVVGVWLGYMLILFYVLCFSELILYYIFLFSVDDLRFFNYIMIKIKLRPVQVGVFCFTFLLFHIVHRFLFLF